MCSCSCDRSDEVLSTSFQQVGIAELNLLKDRVRRTHEHLKYAVLNTFLCSISDLRGWHAHGGINSQFTQARLRALEGWMTVPRANKPTETRWKVLKRTKTDFILNAQNASGARTAHWGTTFSTRFKISAHFSGSGYKQAFHFQSFLKFT